MINLNYLILRVLCIFYKVRMFRNSRKNASYHWLTPTRANSNIFARRSIYTDLIIQTGCFVVLLHLRLDMQDASNQERNPVDFTWVGYITTDLAKISVETNGFFFSYIRMLSATKSLNSWDLCIYAYEAAGSPSHEFSTHS